MPNWCDTHYTIYGSKDTRKTIVDAIRRVEKKSKKENAKYEKEKARLEKQGLASSEIFEKLREKNLWWHCDIWLYSILLELGYSEKFLETFHENIRGYITDYDEGEDDLSIYCDTAWVESYGFRHLLLDKFQGDDPDIKILYTAEEPGMDYFYTNDDDYVGEYVVDIEDDSTDYESEDSVISIVNDRLNLECKTVEEAIAAANKHNEETDKYDHIWIHQFSYCND